jgi:hypothetical protein
VEFRDDHRFFFSGLDKTYWSSAVEGDGCASDDFDSTIWIWPSVSTTTSAAPVALAARIARAISSSVIFAGQRGITFSKSLDW